MKLPTFDFERKYWDEGARIVVGVDEAGRGPLAGPVVAGAVIVRPEISDETAKNPAYKIIRDSKTLSFRQREKAFELIEKNFPFGVGWSDEKTIDRINILEAAYLAMKKALTDIKRKIGNSVDVILIDGRSSIPNISIKQENIVGGDKFSFSISAASIVAKVMRDRMMLDFHKKFPEYGFAKHKGYGTKEHFEMIGKYGHCEIHRKSFRLKSK
jgi:ribonuclease HII